MSNLPNCPKCDSEYTYEDGFLTHKGMGLPASSTSQPTISTGLRQFMALNRKFTLKNI